MQEITTYLAPRRLDEALHAMADGGATVFCGGTDLSPQTESGARQYQAKLLNLRRIEGLAGIDAGGSEIRIGATTTVSEIRASAALAEIAPVLVEAAERFASEQLRNAASIGGNLCNASPAADGAVMLMALQAEVELRAFDRVRRLPLSRFLRGVRSTALAPGELLTAVHVPARSPRAWSRFLKLGHRRYLVISVVMVGVLLDFDRDDRVTACGIAVGACAPTALSLSGLEQALLGQPRARLADCAQVWLAADGLQALAPIDDVRGSGAYRREMAAVAIGRLLREAADGAQP